MAKVKQIERTEHGDDIAGQIQAASAYGASDTLTVSDVWNILDNLHTVFMDSEPKLAKLLSGWMDKLDKDWDIETY